MSNSRLIALNILSSTLSGKSSLENSTVPAQDTAFINMLILTALRHLTYIRKILKSLISQKLSKQDPLVRNALFLATAELLYMHSPDYAVINSYVEIIKNQKNQKLSGFINAVLRRISKNKEQFIKDDKGEFFSQSFRTLLHQDYSPKTINNIEKSSILEPNLDLTCHPSYNPSALNGTILPLGTIRLSSKGKIEDLPDYQQGLWWVQDFSSSLPIKMLDNLKGKNVLELCSAPGGKTAQLLSLGAKVTCLDISASRLEVLKQNLFRLNLKAENIICDDAVNFLKNNQTKYDIIVLDAPCSATGTLRRHPEIVHTKDLTDVQKMSKIQQQILSLVDNSLTSNGILLYCTCSLSHLEGEKQIELFLNSHPDYSLESLASYLPKELQNILSPQGYIRILPQYLKKYNGADGFFIAKLLKQ